MMTGSGWLVALEDEMKNVEIHLLAAKIGFFTQIMAFIKSIILLKNDFAHREFLPHILCDVCTQFNASFFSSLKIPSNNEKMFAHCEHALLEGC